ncbi:MAG: 1-acyl-sn-glycerol-3-phosphate acyltransferase [Rhodanobacteraceae bacterium]|nr:1-acyl-sn-glycerol-3-phosphate acyltransferase [Rhodanobacteraceae bacterium]
MPEPLDRPWRICATGFCFAMFGLGGLVLRILVFPLLALLVRDRLRRAELARAAVHRGFRIFIELMRLTGVLRYDIVGRAKLNRRGLLILANHPTLIDVVFLGSLIEHLTCVVKADLKRNPFTRGPVLGAGYICNDEPEGAIEDCRRALDDGGNLVIFPEGTRTAEDGIIRLRRGAAQIAVRCRRDITPVTISCIPRSLTRWIPWYVVPLRPMHFRIEVRDDIPIAPYTSGDEPEALAARRLTQDLNHYFLQETAAHAGA